MNLTFITLTLTLLIIITVLVCVILRVMPNDRMIFASARVGCSSMSSTMDGLHYCSFLSKYTEDWEAPAPCRYESCPKRRGEV